MIAGDFGGGATTRVGLSGDAALDVSRGCLLRSRVYLIFALNTLKLIGFYAKHRRSRRRIETAPRGIGL